MGVRCAFFGGGEGKGCVYICICAYMWIHASQVSTKFNCFFGARHAQMVVIAGLVAVLVPLHLCVFVCVLSERVEKKKGLLYFIWTWIASKRRSVDREVGRGVVVSSVCLTFPLVCEKVSQMDKPRPLSFHAPYWWL